MNRLFVAYKPAGVSSNHFLGRLKRKYKVKKAGFSGTLDPFAKGVLIIALGNATRLFRFLDKTPKRYRATLWLGAHSDTLDIEKVDHIDTIAPFETAQLEAAVASLKGDLRYLPPRYSAKKIDGRRAYDLAREGEHVDMKAIESTIYEIKLLHYVHPFVTFEATVSEGTYIRSLGEIICERLGVEFGALSALERLNEGRFYYNNEAFLNIKEYLNMPQNRYNGDPENIRLGKKLRAEDFSITQEGCYWCDQGDTISIIQITPEKVSYLLNKVQTC